jgi:hypothetical protein
MVEMQTQSFQAYKVVPGVFFNSKVPVKVIYDDRVQQLEVQENNQSSKVFRIEEIDKFSVLNTSWAKETTKGYDDGKQKYQVSIIIRESLDIVAQFMM